MPENQDSDPNKSHSFQKRQVVFYSTLAFLVLVLILFVFRGLMKTENSSISEPDRIPKPNPEYIGILTKANWENITAEAVVSLNAELFEIQANENPNALRAQLKLLAELGKYPALQRFIKEHPETAALLAGAENPERIVESLDTSEEDYPFVSGIYVRHALPNQANDIAAAFVKNRDLLISLQRRGLIGCESLFIFDRQNPASEEYEDWLREVLESKLAGSDLEIASFINLVMRQGKKIRKRILEDETFRMGFRGEYWPRLHRVVEADPRMLDHYLYEDRIWDLISLDNGEELLKRCGLLPIDLLWGSPENGHDPYPKSLHPIIIQLLLRQEDHAFSALMKYRNEPHFHRILTRNISSDTLSAVMTQLIKAGPNYPQKLSLFERLSDAALADEVGPPTSGIITWVPFYYTIYEVPKKLIQGREPTGMDWFSFAADPLLLVVDVMSAGQTTVGRKVLVAGTKEIAEVELRKITEKSGGNLFATTLRNKGLELAKKQLGEKTAEKMSEKELINWTITGGISEFQNIVKNALGKATTFEITKPVQFFFQYSGIGRQNMKRFSGLEARIFMRGDAKVYVQLTNLSTALLGSRCAAFFSRTAQDLALGAAFESEPGQQVVQEGVRQTISAKDQLKAWQQNVSAWWLLNASYDGSLLQKQEFEK